MLAIYTENISVFFVLSASPYVTEFILLLSRESIGSSCILGDDRWAGTYGVSADYIALTHCSVEYIALDEILVSSVTLFCH
jgi:hypothetical protein